MSDSPQPSRRLSEISHLFLSSVRDKQTGGAARPMRKAPGTFQQEPVLDTAPAAHSPVSPIDRYPAQMAPVEMPAVEMSPEEFASVNDRSELDPARLKPIQAVIASHYAEQMSDRVQQYAASLCTDGGRVGVIYVNSSDVRISCIERNPHADMQLPEPAPEMMDARRLHESLVELNADVDQWLLILTDPRNNDARDLLRLIVHWTLICDVNHDSVVTSYRTLKGLADPAKPRVVLSVHSPRDAGELDRVYRKLSGVCEQFLQLPLETGRPFSDHDDVIEHIVMHATASHNKAALASPAHWKVLVDFALQAQHDRPDTSVPRTITPQAITPSVAAIRSSDAVDQRRAEPPRPVMRAISPTLPTLQPPETAAVEHAFETGMSDAVIGSIGASHEGFETVIDLPNSDLAAPAIVSAVVKGSGELIDSPIKPPSCPQASVTVSRDHRLVLVAVCRQGLHEMRSIANAYRWLAENRNLIGMAMPQMSIDISAAPRLQLLVDHTDIGADTLAPLMQSTNVTIRTYRKLRWGEKTGLLLEAA